jgi:hypothetical protein
VSGLGDDEAGRCGAGGQRGRRAGQLGQVAAVDGERAGGADRALVDEQGAAVGAEAGVDGTDATSDPGWCAAEQRQRAIGRWSSGKWCRIRCSR